MRTEDGTDGDKQLRVGNFRSGQITLTGVTQNANHSFSLLFYLEYVIGTDNLLTECRRPLLLNFPNRKEIPAEILIGDEDTVATFTISAFNVETNSITVAPTA